VNNLTAVGCIGFAAVCASILAPLSWMTGLARLGAARVSGFFSLVPIVTTAPAVLLLGESLSGRVLGGSLLAVSGVVLAEYAARRGCGRPMRPDIPARSARNVHLTSTLCDAVALQSGNPIPRPRRSPSMNTPGKPRPTWKQWHVLLVILAIALLVALIIVTAPW